MIAVPGWLVGAVGTILLELVALIIWYITSNKKEK